MPSAGKLARPVPLDGIIQENFENLERKDVDAVVEKIRRTADEVMDLLRKTVLPEFREAISVLAPEASKRDLAARQGARNAHSQWLCK